MSNKQKSDLLDGLLSVSFQCEKCGNGVVRKGEFEQEYVCKNPCPPAPTIADLPEWATPQRGDLDYGV